MRENYATTVGAYGIITRLNDLIFCPTWFEHGIQAIVALTILGQMS